MPGLILEGGTFRPIFSAGAMDALLDNDIMFDYVIGVSAGITNGYSYVSKQRRRNLEILEKYRNDKRYLSLGNFFKCKSMFGLDFVFDDIPNKLLKYDLDTLNSYDGKIIVGVTNAVTGKTEYLDGKQIDEKCTILQATCALPLFFPAIKYNNNEYYDGGLCDPIPIKKSISDGNKKNLIILTRPEGYIKTQDKKNKIAIKILHNKYPKLKEILTNRHILYNETVKFCEQLEQDGKAIIIRPDASEAIDSFEKDIEKLTASYQHGYNKTLKNIDKIKELFE